MWEVKMNRAHHDMLCCISHYTFQSNSLAEAQRWYFNVWARFGGHLFESTGDLYKIWCHQVTAEVRYQVARILCTRWSNNHSRKLREVELKWEMISTPVSLGFEFGKSIFGEGNMQYHWHAVCPFDRLFLSFVNVKTTGNIFPQ